MFIIPLKEYCWWISVVCHPLSVELLRTVYKSSQREKNRHFHDRSSRKVRISYFLISFPHVEDSTMKFLPFLFEKIIYGIWHAFSDSIFLLFSCLSWQNLLTSATFFIFYGESSVILRMYSIISWDHRTMSLNWRVSWFIEERQT